MYRKDHCTVHQMMCVIACIVTFFISLVSNLTTIDLQTQKKSLLASNMNVHSDEEDQKVMEDLW